jgi:hypothetical protein
MHPDRSSAGEQPPPVDDIRNQGVTLMHALHRHPTLLTIPELVREVASGSEEVGEAGSIERAVRDLTGVGLLHCANGLAVPSPAALRFLAILQVGAA